MAITVEFIAPDINAEVPQATSIPVLLSATITELPASAVSYTAVIEKRGRWVADAVSSTWMTFGGAGGDSSVPQSLTADLVFSDGDYQYRAPIVETRLDILIGSDHYYIDGPTVLFDIGYTFSETGSSIINLSVLTDNVSSSSVDATKSNSISAFIEYPWQDRFVSLTVEYAVVDHGSELTGEEITYTLYTDDHASNSPSLFTAEFDSEDNGLVSGKDLYFIITVQNSLTNEEWVLSPLNIIGNEYVGTWEKNKFLRYRLLGYI